MKRQTSWNLLDYLLLLVSIMAMAQQWTALWMMRQASSLIGSYSSLLPTMLMVGTSVVAIVLLVLVLRRFDSILERVVGMACIWGIWYLMLSMVTFYSMLRLAQQAME